jgi:hypothetical protein
MAFRLLVEGPDDLHLIKNLTRVHGLDLAERSEIHDCGGVAALLGEVLPAHLRVGSYDALAVIVDADENIESRWQSLRDRLTVAGYEVPVARQRSGLILRDRRPAVGVWMMPDNTMPGTLETFAERMIPNGDELWPMARAAVAGIPAASRRFTPAHTRKAEIHTYLAWQEEPGTPLGLAVTKRYFDSHTSAATEFIAWLRQLLHGS